MLFQQPNQTILCLLMEMGRVHSITQTAGKSDLTVTVSSDPPAVTQNEAENGMRGY